MDYIGLSSFSPFNIAIKINISRSPMVIPWIFREPLHIMEPILSASAMRAITSQGFNRDGEASMVALSPGRYCVVGNCSGSKRWYLQKLNDSIDILKMVIQWFSIPGWLHLLTALPPPPYAFTNGRDASYPQLKISCHISSSHGKIGYPIKSTQKRTDSVLLSILKDSVLRCTTSYDIFLL